MVGIYKRTTSLTCAKQNVDSGPKYGPKSYNDELGFCDNTNETEDFTRWKAHLGALGFEQVIDIAYQEIFSPTVSCESKRVNISLAANCDNGIQKFDVKAAFPKVV